MACCTEFVDIVGGPELGGADKPGGGGNPEVAGCCCLAATPANAVIKV